MKRVAALVLVSLFVFAGGVGVWAWHRGSAMTPATDKASLASAATSLIAKGESAPAVGGRMAGDDGMADTVIFLFVAALRARCAPERGHDLPRMAVMAGLPVLSLPTSSLDAGRTRQAISGLVRQLVPEAPCHGPLDLAIGPYRRHIDPERYASAFPDSYFDPSLEVVPDEFGGLPLSRRADDPCGRVAYAVLPLDAAEPWQCSGLRAAARSRIRKLCSSHPADAAAVQIRQITDALPSTCQ
jgi:hypothetical protein